MNDYGIIISIPIPKRPDGTPYPAHWAYAMYEPTPEDREAQAESLRELGRKAAQYVDELVMKALLGK